MSGYVYLVRHGITSWNKGGRLQGEADIPLSEEGLEQATLIGETFQQLAPKKIYCSPLSRALDTSKQIQRFHPGLETVQDERLSEIRFGDFSGKTMREIADENTGFLELREANKWNLKWPGGESYQDVQVRLTSFLEDYGLDLTKIDGKNDVIVSHETTNKVLIGLLLELDKESVLGIAHPNRVIYRLSHNFIERFDIANPSQGWAVGTLDKTPQT